MLNKNDTILFKSWFQSESLHESKDSLNQYLIGSRILGFKSVTDGNNDYNFINCEDYKLEWAARDIDRIWALEKKVAWI